MTVMMTPEVNKCLLESSKAFQQNKEIFHSTKNATELSKQQ